MLSGNQPIQFRRALALATLALGVAVAARADLRASYATGPLVFSGASTSVVRGINVDVNRSSAWYGYVFVADSGGTATAPQRRIMIFRPDPEQDRNGASAYVDTGATIAVPDQTGGAGANVTPFDVFIGPDDTVWVANYDDRTVETFALPGTVPTVAGSMGSTAIQIRMGDFDTGAVADMKANGAPDTTTVGSPRALWVRGSISDATVWLGNFSSGPTNSTAQKYTVQATDAATSGTADLVWSRYIGNGSAPYGVTADPDGNAYVPVSVVNAGESILRKFAADGTEDTTWKAPLVAGQTYAAQPDTIFVPDASLSGGGYLYYTARAGSSSGPVTALRYDLSGNFLDGFGPALTGAPATYQTLAVTGSSPAYAGADDQGNIYVRSIKGSSSAVQKVYRRVPFVVESTAATSAGAAVKSSPTAVDGVVYFGADDGKLYAYTTADGNPVAGFPVDINVAVGATVKLLGRPGVYYGTGEKAIYVTTDRGDVARVNPDGTVVWTFSLYAGTGTNTATSPAVTPAGEVIAAINGTNGLQVVKLSQADGSLMAASPELGPTTGSLSSPAVEQEGAKVYVGSQEGTTGDLWMLNGSDLTVLTSFALGEGVVAPPNVKGIDAYVGTLAGNLYKVNSATMATDPVFGLAAGTAGRAAIGEPLVTDAFPNTSSILPGGVFYVGSSAGKVFGVNAVDGAFTTFFDTGDATATVGGLVINRDTNILGFGTAFGSPTAAGKFYEMTLTDPGHPTVYAGYGALRTAPTLDRTTGRFFAGSDDKNVYAFPAQ